MYLGALPTALAYVLFASGLRRLPTATVTTLVLAEPVVATLLAVAVLGERLGLVAGLGCLTVLGALVLLAAPAPAPGGAP